jgi:transcriptional regulator with XRE-family HTH domain
METNEYYFYLGKILRTRRKAEGLTLETLSRQIRKNGSTISKYESGTVSIPVDVLVDICEVLHIDVSVLLHHVDYRCYQEMSLKQDWIYWYDGIARKLCLGVLEYTRENEPAAFFRDVRDKDNPYDCYSIYCGCLSTSDHSLNCVMRNSAQPYDVLTIGLPMLSAEAKYKLGLITTLDNGYRNTAFKCLSSKTCMWKTNELEKILRLSGAELRAVRNTNIFGIW